MPMPYLQMAADARSAHPGGFGCVARCEGARRRARELPLHPILKSRTRWVL